MPRFLIIALWLYKKTFFVFRNYTIEYLGVKGHYINILLLKSSEIKIMTCIKNKSIHICGWGMTKQNVSHCGFCVQGKC